MRLPCFPSRSVRTNQSAPRRVRHAPARAVTSLPSHPTSPGLAATRFLTLQPRSCPDPPQNTPRASNAFLAASAPRRWASQTERSRIIPEIVSLCPVLTSPRSAVGPALAYPVHPTPAHSSDPPPKGRPVGIDGFGTQSKPTVLLSSHTPPRVPLSHSQTPPKHPPKRSFSCT